MPKTIDMDVNLSVDDVLSAISSQKSEFKSMVKDNTFILHRKQNSFATTEQILYAIVENNGTGTKIHAEIGVHPFIKKFLTYWFSVIVGISALTLLFYFKLIPFVEIKAFPTTLILTLTALILIGVAIAIVSTRPLHQTDLEKLEELLKSQFRSNIIFFHTK